MRKPPTRFSFNPLIFHLNSLDWIQSKRSYRYRSSSRNSITSFTGLGKHKIVAKKFEEEFKMPSYISQTLNFRTLRRCYVSARQPFCCLNAKRHHTLRFNRSGFYPGMSPHLSFIHPFMSLHSTVRTIRLHFELFRHDVKSCMPILG